MSHFRHLIAVLTIAATLLAPPLFAFDSPLSPEAIREAYFLGQRRDEKFSDTLAKYTQALDLPKTGPYIRAVSFLTPYAQVLTASQQRSSGYSAQQAQLDFLGKPERIVITVEIDLTDSYPAVLTRPTGSRRDSPTGFVLRPSNFWHDFHVSVFSGSDRTISPLSLEGQPTYRCTDSDCTLSGATITLTFPVEALASDTTVQIDPPEGDQVGVLFDVSSLR